jgi:4-hydroxy-2-oxoheptanedioate aldolase
MLITRWMLVPLMLTAALSPGASEPPPRLNRIIDRLEKNEPAFGAFASNKSPDGAAAIARSPLDFVIYDMEHAPLDFPGFRVFTQFMLDPHRIAEKGNVQPDVVPLLRLPFNGRENAQWMVKQALDIGAYGILFPHVSTVEEARAIVRSSRYPQPPGAADQEPEGQRGSGAGIASRLWGLSGADYARRADTWPLDPEGEIFLAMLIENREGVANVEAIAREVKGIGCLMAAPGDLSMSYGAVYDRSLQPQVEEAIQKVLAASKAAGVACGITAGKDNVAERIRQGFRVLIVGADDGWEALDAGRDAAARIRENQH